MSQLSNLVAILQGNHNHRSQSPSQKRQPRQQYKHALITGGSSGIGKAIAKELTRTGRCQRITILARDETKLAQAKFEIEEASSPNNLPSSSTPSFLVSTGSQQRPLLATTISTISADVTEYSEVVSAIKTAVERQGPPDLVIASAGIACAKHFTNISLAEHREVMDVDYYGVLHTILAALPYMRTGSRIAVIASGAGVVGLYGYSAYGPSKAALINLVECLRPELRELGIDISFVISGDTDTPQLKMENEIKPAATRALTETAKVWSAEAVAKAILRGIERGQFEITTGGPALYLLLKLHSLINPYYGNTLTG
jgi:3-dehydrosphinganine reductase